MTRPTRGPRRGAITAGLLLILLLALPVAFLLTGAAPQDDERSVYPDFPWGAPPATYCEDSLADSEATMKPYTELITGTKETFAMTPIAGGTFLLGSPPDEKDRQEWEGPQVKVTLSPFWMSTHEVRWDEYRQFMDTLDKSTRKRTGAEPETQDAWADAVSRPTPPYVPMDFDFGVEGYPAISMTQFAAKQYTKWLSMKTGRFYRLPTEAEWEYACRAGSTGSFSYPDGEVDAHSCWFDNSDGQYQKVGSHKPNAFGLFDMHGNVAEWCLDTFTKDGYSVFAAQAKEGPVVDPVQWPTKLYPRVARGGHWDDDPDRQRCASRRGSSDAWKVQDPQLPKSIWYHTDAPWLGIRLVRPLNPPPFKEWGKYHDADVDSIIKIQTRQRTGER
jgi:formylglycine-generating enzyme required for sulfatase activity